MIRRSLIPLAALVLALALPACGSSSAATTGATAARPKSTGVALKKIGQFESPLYVAGAPGFPRLIVVGQQTGPIECLKDVRKGAKPFRDISAEISEGSER